MLTTFLLYNTIINHFCYLYNILSRYYIPYHLRIIISLTRLKTVCVNTHLQIIYDNESSEFCCPLTQLSLFSEVDHTLHHLFAQIGDETQSMPVVHIPPKGSLCGIFYLLIQTSLQDNCTLYSIMLHPSSLIS